MKDKQKNQKGITLIALVITIIVLLILAGVSISMISSQDGILDKATNAKKVTGEKAVEDRVKLATQAALIDGEGTINLEDKTGTAKGSLYGALKKEFGETDDIVKKYNEDGKLIINGKEYSVGTNGSIEEMKYAKLSSDKITESHPASYSNSACNTMYVNINLTGINDAYVELPSSVEWDGKTYPVQEIVLQGENSNIKGFKFPSTMTSLILKATLLGITELVIPETCKNAYVNYGSEERTSLMLSDSAILKCKGDYFEHIGPQSFKGTVYVTSGRAGWGVFSSIKALYIEKNVTGIGYQFLQGITNIYYNGTIEEFNKIYDDISEGQAFSYEKVQCTDGVRNLYATN